MSLNFLLNWQCKFLHFTQLIFDRNLTVPPVDDPLLHPYQDLIYPILSPLFITATKHSLKMEVGGSLYLWQLITIIGFVISLVILITVKKKDWKARPRWVSIYSI